MQLIFTRGNRTTAVRIRPWITGIVVLASLLFGTLYIAAAAYLLLSDDLLIAAVEERQTIHNDYEERIAVLRTKIDRITSRHLVAQQSMERQLQGMTARQAALDVRQDIIANLSQAVRGADLTTDRASGKTSEEAAADLRSSAPASEATLRGTPDANRDREARLMQFEAIGEAAGQLARRQDDYVNVIARTVSGKADELTGILRGIRVAPHSGIANVGGPFVMPTANSDLATFRSNVALVTDEIERFARIRSFANSLPLKPPLGKATITSGYGRRVDPFLGRPAMHSGVDFRARSGNSVRAMAPGVVITAKYSGGYGKLVAIDHGHGIVTRFGHLRRITVRKGQSVAKGELIGEVGSTGRSTGPHLHYEVRQNGKSVDPGGFFRAGRQIRDLL